MIGRLHGAPIWFTWPSWLLTAPVADRRLRRSPIRASLFFTGTRLRVQARGSASSCEGQEGSPAASMTFANSPRTPRAFHGSVRG
jgi:hypothetical protein